MRAVDARDALLGQHPVQLAARAAIAVEAENFVVVGAMAADFGSHGFGDSCGAIVQQRGQAGHIEGAERAVAQGQNFARERAAGDHEHTPRAAAAGHKALLLRLVGRRVQTACAEPCRRDSSARAVSTATAASRQ